MSKPEPTLNVRKYNRYAWDRQVDKEQSIHHSGFIGSHRRSTTR